MNFKWSTIDKPVFVLAPMAEITTFPFRSICRDFGADITYTPMLSADAIIHNPEKTLKIAKFTTEERPVIVQIFGYDGGLIAKAANIVQKSINPAGIDMNMGCPAPKITGNECGSGLLRDYNKAFKLAETVRSGYSGQLSAKLRLGWREYDVLPFVQRLEQIGIDAIAIHGRTAKQGYTGTAEWEKIYEIASNVTIPVLGNGDVTDWQDAWARLDGSRLAGVMIARGALGHPWIFKEIKNKNSLHINNQEIYELISKQTELTIKYLGDENKAIREMRKHFGWYLKGFKGAKEIRSRLMQADSLSEVEAITRELIN